MKPSRLVALLAAGCVTQSVLADYSAHANCSAGVPAGRDTGLGTFLTAGGAHFATITWTRDATNLDNTPLTGGPFVNSEPKFLTTSTGIAGRTFTGISTVIGTGAYGSKTAHTGSGSSAISSFLPFPMYTASWSVTAAPLVGTPPAGATAVASGYTKGSDPWYLPMTDLNAWAGFDSIFDLRIPFAMDAGTAAGDGASVTYDVSYETNAGTLDLMHIAASGTGATVWTNPLVSIGLESIGSVVSDPNLAGAAITPVALAGLLSADMADGHLDFSQSLALTVSNLMLPSGTLAGPGGMGAAVHVDSTAYCNAQAAPTPGTISLLALGLTALARRRRR